MIFLGYCVDGALLIPSQTLSLLPQAELDCFPLRIFEDAEAVLFPFVPPAFVSPAIRPAEGPVALLLVFTELALVDDAVRVNVNAVAVHLVLQPAPVVLPSVLPEMLPRAAHLVIGKIASVNRAIGLSLLSKALFLSLFKLAFVHSSIRQNFLDIPEQDAVPPGALELYPVLGHLPASSMAQIRLPQALLSRPVLLVPL